MLDLTLIPDPSANVMSDPNAFKALKSKRKDLLADFNSSKAKLALAQEELVGAQMEFNRIKELLDSFNSVSKELFHISFDEDQELNDNDDFYKYKPLSVLVRREISRMEGIDISSPELTATLRSKYTNLERKPPEKIKAQVSVQLSRLAKDGKILCVRQGKGRQPSKYQLLNT